MTSLEYMWIDLYMAALVLILYFLGCRGKTEKGTSLWYYKYSLFIQFVVLMTDSGMWFIEEMRKGLFLVYEFLWIINFFAFLAFVLFYSLYLYSYVKEEYGLEYKYPYLYFYIIAFISSVLWVSSLFNHSVYIITPEYTPEYTDLYWVILALIVLSIIPIIQLFFRLINKVDKRFLALFACYVFIPLVLPVMEIILGVNCLIYAYTSLFILFIYVGINQKKRIISYNQKVEIQKKESELREIEQKVMMGNIQPFFIQSILASIADMDEKDPKRAETTTSSFATYLRMNLNSVGKNEPIPFEEEVRHADSFIELESNIRAGKIRVEHDIEAWDFFIPVLTLQPIVENAIVHGILPKGGGTIKLWSREESNAFTVGIEDDGVGFDSTLVSDGVGIKNTRNRIEKFCGGSLTIESGKNIGTKVTIIIPKKRMQDSKREI